MLLRNLVRLSVFISVLFIANRLTAQNGTIEGIIVNKKTGETVPCTSVVIEALRNGAVSGVDGKYIITKVPAGKYTLKVSSILYESIELTEVEVADGQPATVNILLNEASNILGEVLVTSARRMNSEVAMIQAQKSATAVVSAVSSQQIVRTQDRDASEVIKRIPGISVIDNRFIVARGLAQRYNNVWINNNAVPSSEADSRSFSCDMIPSGQIENIMIVKSPAPELPADFTGGFVKIATKNMPSENSLQFSYGININTNTHFNEFKYANGSSTDFLGFDRGLRAMRSIVPSQRIDDRDATLVTDVTQSGFNNDWTVHSKKPFVDHRFSVVLNRFAKIGENAQFGMVAALNYSYSYQAYRDMNNSRFGVYNKTDDEPVYLYKYADDQYTVSAKTGGMMNFVWIPSSRHRLEFRNIFNQQGRDRYTYRDGWQNISARYEQIKEEYFYNSRGSYTGQLGGTHELSAQDKIDWTAGYSYANRNQPDRRQIDREEDGERYSLNNIIRDFNRLDENMYSLVANYSRPFMFGSFVPMLKAGFYAEYRSRDYRTRYFIYKMNLANLPPDFPYFDVASEMMRPEYFAADRFRISDASDRTNDYSGTDLLAGGYAALNIPLGKFNVYAGVRYEYNKMSLANFVTIDTDQTEDYDYNRSGIFPSVNATYNFNKTHLLRAAFGRSVNRQEFRELSPSTYYDFDLFSFVRGNRQLKQAYINNFDLRYEIYPSSGEMISLALFYKHFINPIEWTYIDAGGSYTFTFENAVSADNYGVELDMKKRLDFIGMPDLTLSFNGALIRSRVSFDRQSVEHDRPMQGQSPYLVNTGLFYQHNNLSAGLMYNIIGKRIVGIGRTDNSQGGSIDNDVPDMYELPRHTFDLSFGYRFGKHLELSAGIRDLLAAPLVYKQFPEFIDNAGQVRQREQITKEYRSGRNFSLTVKLSL
jgi:outer membrane receptor for ferrienterochelin and colicin